LVATKRPDHTVTQNPPKKSGLVGVDLDVLPFTGVVTVDARNAAVLTRGSDVFGTAEAGLMAVAA
jgi:hypothetical protein